MKKIFKLRKFVLNESKGVYIAYFQFTELFASFAVSSSSLILGMISFADFIHSSVSIIMGEM